MSSANHMGTADLFSLPATIRYPKRRRRIDANRLRTGGPCRTCKDLEMRYFIRQENLVAIKAAAATHFRGHKRRANRWLYEANPLLDGRSPVRAIVDDYVKEHVLDALARAVDDSHPSV